MSPHFLCCLPIRLGAFVVSFAEFLLSGLVAGLMWLALALNEQGKLSERLSTREKIVVAVFGGLYTILFIASIYGIMGVLRKRVSWIQSFLSFLQAHLIGSIIATIINLVVFFINHENSCITVDENGNCVNTNLSRGAQIAILCVVAVVPILIEAYGCWILSDCVKYLKDKEVYPMTLYPFANRGYAAVGPGYGSKEERDSLTHNSGSATGMPYATGGV